MAPVRVAVTGLTDGEALVVDEVNEGARDTVTMAVVRWVVRGVVDVVEVVMGVVDVVELELLMVEDLEEDVDVEVEVEVDEVELDVVMGVVLGGGGFCSVMTGGKGKPRTSDVVGNSLLNMAVGLKRGSKRCTPVLAGTFSNRRCTAALLRPGL
jgi:hypothetical protein